MTTPSLPASGHGEVAGLVEELRAGLEGVTPGPWSWNRKSTVGPFSLDDAKGNSVLIVEEYAGSAWIEIGKPDENWIAQCSPEKVAKLLAHVDDLTVQLAAAKADAERYLRCMDRRAERIIELTASPTPSPVEARADGVRVKALEWKTVSDHEWRAITIFGDAVIIRGADGWFGWRIAPHTLRRASGSDASLEAAQSALWANYEARVLASIEPNDGALRKALEAAKYWLEEERDSEHPGQTEPVEILRVIDQALDGETLYASQPDPAAEIARLKEERDAALGNADDVYAKWVSERIRAERAESENARLRGAAEPVIANGRITSGGIRRPARSIQVPAEDWGRLRAALANTADRGQEEKGNG